MNYRIAICAASLLAVRIFAVAEQSTIPSTGSAAATETSSGAATSRPASPGWYGSFGYVAKPTYDSEPPQLPEGLPSGGILVYSKTNGWRDLEALAASNATLAAIAAEHKWPYFETENAAIMNKEQLSRFKVVVWNNNSGDTLTAAQREAFKNWLENGGTYVGLHGAGGDPRNNRGHTSLADWDWYIDSVVGAQFRHHSAILPADIHLELSSPITKGLPAIWHRADEYYAFTEDPRQRPGFHILATVDENSYTTIPDARMGPDHPLVWWHCVGSGRALYSALAHGATMYTEPLMIKFLDNALSWSLQKDHSCPATH